MCVCCLYFWIFSRKRFNIMLQICMDVKLGISFSRLALFHFHCCCTLKSQQFPLKQRTDLTKTFRLVHSQSIVIIIVSASRGKQFYAMNSILYFFPTINDFYALGFRIFYSLFMDLLHFTITNRHEPLKDISLIQ